MQARKAMLVLALVVKATIASLKTMVAMQARKEMKALPARKAMKARKAMVVKAMMASLKAMVAMQPKTMTLSSAEGWRGCPRRYHEGDESDAVV